MPVSMLDALFVVDPLWDLDEDEIETENEPCKHSPTEIKSELKNVKEEGEVRGEGGEGEVIAMIEKPPCPQERSRENIVEGGKGVERVVIEMSRELVRLREEVVALRKEWWFGWSHGLVAMATLGMSYSSLLLYLSLRRAFK